MKTYFQPTRRVIQPGFRQSLCIVRIFSFCMLLTSTGWGADRFWQGTTGGDWYDQSKWGVNLIPQLGDPVATVPGVGDRGIFGKGGTAYDVSFADHVDLLALQVPDDFVTFDLLGRQLAMTSVLHVGNVTDDIGSLTLRDGFVQTPFLLVGFNGGDGRLFIENDAELTVEGSQSALDVTFNVAGSPLINGGLGRVDVFGLLEVNDTDAYVGSRIAGDGEVNVDGGAWNITDSLVIGHNAGDGQVSILNGGTVFAGGTTYVGETGNSFLVETGVGRIDIEDGILTSAGTATIGSADDSFGEVDVAGANSAWNINGSLIVGEFGIGNLHVRDESDVHVANSTLIAVGTNEALLNITGLGTMINDGPMYVGGSTSAQGGPGHLLVQSDGRLEVGAFILVWPTGRLELAGGTIATGGLLLEPGSTFDFTAGTLAIQGGSFSGVTSLSFGGTTLSDPPTLRFEAGAFAPFKDFEVGSVANGVAVAEFNNGILEATDDVIVGGTEATSLGDGTLKLQNGSSARADDLLRIWPDGELTIDDSEFLAGDLHIQGTVKVTGASASLQVDAANGFGNLSGIHIGLSSTPTDVQIESGGSLSSTTTGIVVGSDNSSSAIVRVTDSGSSLNVREATVGGLGDGTLIVEGGATAFLDGGMTLASGPSAFATVVIDNPGTKLTNEADMTVARFGFGVLQVSDGASMHTLADTAIASDVGVGGSSLGSITVLGNGATWKNDESTFVGGDSSGPGGDGFLEVRDGGIVDNGGLLRVWPTGTLTMKGGELRSHDVLLENSTLVLEGGTIQVSSGQFRTPLTSLVFGGVDPNNPVSFEFLNGADAQTTFAWKVGRSANTHGTTTVSGVNVNTRSTLRGSGGGGGADLMVGVDGNGVLNILDGGLVDFGDDVCIGNGVGDGHIVVDGVHNGIRSTLLATRSGGGAVISVGGNHDGTANTGRGELEVLNGALAHTTGDMFIAKTPGSRGDVRVDRSQDGIDAGLRVADDVFLGGSASAPGGNGEILLGPNGVMSIGDTLKVWDGGFVDMDEGTMIVNHIDLSDAPSGPFNFFLGRVEMNRVTGDFDNGAGTLAPGASSIAAATIDGDYTQFSQGILEIEMTSNTSGTGYDVLDVTGRAILSGGIHVVVDPGFVPSVGQVFTIMTFGLRAGVFESITVDGPTVFEIVHHADRVELVVLQSRRQGDITGDGAVDQADYGELHDCFTGPDSSAVLDATCQLADFDGDGDVDQTDVAKLQTLLILP